MPKISRSDEGEGIELFKLELKSVRPLRQRIKKLGEEIALLNYEMEGVRAVDYSRIPNGSGRPLDLSLIDEKAEAERERDEAQARICAVRETLEKTIPSETDRRIIWAMYADGEKYDLVADRFGFASRQALFKHVDAVLKKYVN